MCNTGFSATADQMVRLPSLSHDRKYTHLRVVYLRLEGNLVSSCVCWSFTVSSAPEAAFVWCCYIARLFETKWSQPDSWRSLQCTRRLPEDRHSYVDAVWLCDAVFATAVAVGRQWWQDVGGRLSDVLFLLLTRTFTVSCPSISDVVHRSSRTCNWQYLLPLEYIKSAWCMCVWTVQHVGRREPCHTQRWWHSTRNLQSDAQKDSRNSLVSTDRSVGQLWPCTQWIFLWPTSRCFCTGICITESCARYFFMCCMWSGSLPFSSPVAARNTIEICELLTRCYCDKMFSVVARSRFWIANYEVWIHQTKFDCSLAILIMCDFVIVLLSLCTFYFILNRSMWDCRYVINAYLLTYLLNITFCWHMVWQP